MTCFSQLHWIELSTWKHPSMHLPHHHPFTPMRGIYLPPLKSYGAILILSDLITAHSGKWLHLRKTMLVPDFYPFHLLYSPKERRVSRAERLMKAMGASPLHTPSRSLAVSNVSKEIHPTSSGGNASTEETEMTTTEVIRKKTPIGFSASKEDTSPAKTKRSPAPFTVTKESVYTFEDKVVNSTKKDKRIRFSLSPSPSERQDMRGDLSFASPLSPTA
jgi:hypothetical protein